MMMMIERPERDQDSALNSSGFRPHQHNFVDHPSDHHDNGRGSPSPAPAI